MKKRFYFLCIVILKRKNTHELYQIHDGIILNETPQVPN